MSVRFKISEVRHERKLSQEDVARATGMKLTRYIPYDRGSIKNPSIEVLSDLCRFFGCKIGDLMECEDS